MLKQIDQKDGKRFEGEITAVRGSVVDAAFPKRLPPINSLLRAGKGHRVIVETTDHLDNLNLRGIALTSTAGLSKADRPDDGCGDGVQGTPCRHWNH